MKTSVQQCIKILLSSVDDSRESHIVVRFRCKASYVLLDASASTGERRETQRKRGLWASGGDNRRRSGGAQDRQAGRQEMNTKSYRNRTPQQVGRCTKNINFFNYFDLLSFKTSDTGIWIFNSRIYCIQIRYLKIDIKI